MMFRLRLLRWMPRSLPVLALSWLLLLAGWLLGQEVQAHKAQQVQVAGPPVADVAGAGIGGAP